jgi:GNAT superfamily N-acetyltransferase
VAAKITVDECGGMFVRRARSGDAERLAAIHVEAWKSAYRGQVPDPHLDALSVRLELWRTLVSESLPSQATLVLVEDEQPIGFAHCTMQGDAVEDELTGEVASMYIEPSMWRRGGGRLLMAAAVDWFRAKGCGEALLWVLDTNTGPRRFYEAMGWTLDGAQQGIELGGKELVEVRYRFGL